VQLAALTREAAKQCLDRRTGIVKLKFGRYRGWDVATVPAAYLKWLRRQSGVDAELRAGIAVALGAKPKTGAIVPRRPAVFDGKLAACGPDGDSDA
jgi:uncharacterized protein (DUF3820 family)